MTDSRVLINGIPADADVDLGAATREKRGVSFARVVVDVVVFFSFLSLERSLCGEFLHRAGNLMSHELT